jgi:probable F420-dependent oxidoreductase
MKVDAVLAARPTTAAERARIIEAASYHGAWIGETKHDPFLLAAVAATATTDVEIGTSVAIAFARSPMTVALQAWDLAELSGGRFRLGLGTQVKAHITRRFSMPWSHPADRFLEYVQAVRAIWRAWRTGERLQFEGRFYQHTLMTPFFTPPPIAAELPPIFLAAVGTRMAEVAGETGDGLFFHTFSTTPYLRDVMIPALRRGQEKSAREETYPFTVCGPVFVVTGETEESLAEARRRTKETIAFYASTPGYRPVLDHHGWGDIQPELTALSRAGRWSELGSLITDEVLEEFAVVGPPEEAGYSLVRRYHGLADRVTLSAPYEVEPVTMARMVDAIRRRL